MSKPKSKKPIPTAKKRRSTSKLLLGVRVFTVALLSMILIVGVRFWMFWNQPVNEDQTIRALAGVPIYPGAQFDEGAKREEQALRQAIGRYDPLATTAGFRSSADPVRDIIPFYEKTLANYGFQKTVIHSTPGAVADATFTNGSTMVTVQITPGGNGEPNVLLLTRIDQVSKAMLTRPTNIVTPEDFQHLRPRSSEYKITSRFRSRFPAQSRS